MRERSSFRDPSGFLFRKEGTLYRQVNRSYEGEYRKLISSGLYQSLVDKRHLIPHVEKPSPVGLTDEAAVVLVPEIVPFISYPYEWCFSQLRDAALATLAIQRLAIDSGMSLKDASAYNIQRYQGSSVLIDTLSFEPYEEGAPWVAYRQFCQHFLAPLVLMTKDTSLGRLSQLFIDGVPLSIASSLTPWKTQWKPGLAMHLHVHARAQAGARQASSAPGGATPRVTKAGMLGLIDSLDSTVRGLSLSESRTTWSDYYAETNYSEAAMEKKRALVALFFDRSEPRPKLVWDLGANTGEFSKIAAERGAVTIACDMDHACVESHYRAVRDAQPLIVPLVQDLSNPSPSIGWAHVERESLVERGPADAILALALVHHLAIGNNVPLEDIADFFAQVGKWAIVEFVPKEDSQTKRLLASRNDVFPNYTIEAFENAFSRRFESVAKEQVTGTERTLYLWKRK